jgi:cellulose synthase/poly-beta-1,6-N-acetylglucosamine synthase-like glycosyltransferase/spore germination protein YaaH/peptidoglycan/xylan/chitin deacetylase (PgdA/CDA1 family)
MSTKGQIFQTASPSRWRKAKWTFRIFLFIFLFLITVLVLAVIRDHIPSQITYNEQSKEYADKLDPSKPFTFTHSGNKKYKGFKDFLVRKIEEDSLKNQRGFKSNTGKNPYVRAAFYTPWTQSTSLPDLEKYGDKLNTIFPEWFFIDTISYKLQTRIDSAGLAMMKKKQLRIMPIFSNFHTGKDFDGSLLHVILNDTVKRNSIIKQLADTLTYYNLQGINIDFEELNEKTNEPLTRFQKELYNRLHSLGMTVTMDVAVKNDDYDYEQLSKYNDYIILMAYDQFNRAGSPGPVSAQKWIEEALDWTAAKIESEKIILGIAGYGYEWYKNEEGRDTVKTITYSDAINNAKAINATIDYDNDSYNLHYSYVKEFKANNKTVEKIKHEVWFTDAATSFNILRFSDEYATAGTALWRMGSEDARIWSFYNQDLSNDALAVKPFDFSVLKNVPFNDNGKPTPIGDEGGELLDFMYSPQEGKIELQLDTTEQLIAEQNYIQLPSGYVYKKFAEDKTDVGPGHKLILTFDDGPDPRWTPRILDILERRKVPATFFIVGLQGEKNIPLLQRINKNGFEIGNHTFTHNNVAKMSPERAEIELRLTRLLIESITGRSTILFRAPYNADSEPQTYEEIEPLARSKKDNYITVGESIDPNDWEEGVTADSIVARTIRQTEERNANIILLHDAGGVTRQATIDALPRIIDYFEKRGCKFTTVADLMGKTKDDVMPPVPQSAMTKVNFFIAQATYWAQNILFSLFIVGIVLSVARIFFMALLASIQRRKEKNAVAAAPWQNNFPFVSIIVPAYNEEVNAVRTVNNLLLQTYPSLKIIFVDDGSKDSTFKKVSEAFAQVPNVQILTKPNGGKASALNYGINLADTEFVVCIDADTQLKPDAVMQLMNKFTGNDMGAVAGNVKVGNEINMITRWQSIEYITSQNFDRRAFDLLNCITVVPGAIGAFRKEAIVKAGGFTTDTLAEDCDLTMRLHRNGYAVRNCNEAISYTEAPETMKQFMKQRFRWSFGVMQCFWKHRDAAFNPRYKNFGLVAMPNILVFQMILPFLAPLADIILVLSLIAAGFGIIPASIGHILLYYFIFTLVDVAGAALAFAFEKEDYKKLLWMIPQRLVYRQLMYYILFKSFNKAIKGELQGWGVLKRTGNVKEVPVT